MSLSKPELETVLRCVDKMFDFRAERDRLRDLLATLEAENKGLAARVAELEARCKLLEELGAELRECAGYLGYAASNDSRCIARAERAVKAWNKEAKL